MKKYIYLVIAVAGVFFMSSCEDFLKTESEGAYASDSYFVTDQQAIDAIDGCYYPLYDEGCFGRELMWEQGAANDFVWGRTRGYPQLATLSLTGSVSPLNDTWNNFTKVMQRSNWVIASLLKKQKNTELTAIETRSLGEAYFLRAFSHFFIAYRYGTNKQGVPFVRNEDFTGPDGYDYSIPPQQASVIDNYKFIIEDLDKAESLLPRVEEYSDADFGRPHKAACAGYKAKVYAYWACWDKSQYANVITEVNKMQSQYGRDLAPDFHDNFTSDYSKWRNSEYLFAELSEGGPHGVYGGCEFPGVSLDNGGWGVFNGWGQFKPSYDIFEELSKDDANVVDKTSLGAWDKHPGNYRLHQTVFEYGDEFTYCGMPKRFYSDRDVESGFAIAKYFEPFTYGEAEQKEDGTWEIKKDFVELGYVGDNGDWPVVRINFPLLRFADCLLLRAEAYLANGKAAEAAADINKIRARVNLKPLPGDATWTDLYHERRCELAFEYSDHLYDLKRWVVGKPSQEIADLAKKELESHPRARRYAERGNADSECLGVFPYGDYEEPAKKWEDWKMVFPYRDVEISNANGALKQNEGY